MKIKDNITFNELLLILSKMSFEICTQQSYIMSDDGQSFTPVSLNDRIENKYFIIFNNLLTFNGGISGMGLSNSSSYNITYMIIEETYKQRIKHRNKQLLKNKIKKIKK